MNPPPDLAIHATGLTKRFGGTHAVDNLELAIPKGCVYGFLGPNGAGKTTTVRMLATLLRPDAGTASVLGLDTVRQAESVRERIALTGQFAALDQDLTGAENLTVAARLLGYRPRAARIRAAELLSGFGLDDAAPRQVKTYSGGMRRRLDIAASLVATPEVLFLDEPTTGLDPASRNQVWATIRALANAGTTVLLTTQYLAEADELASRVAVIDHGHLIAEGSPGELRAAGGTGRLRLRLADAERRPDAAELLHRLLGGSGPGSGSGSVEPAGSDPADVTVAVADAARATEAIAELSRGGIALTGFSLDQPSLEEVFLALTTNAAPAAAAS
ncbi:ATP-binding cassette domain-containing protein [Catenulispora pinisilvae]|uniref:ATP-binding cassette domain-containing protein n=1 Tax=Catenulispora pinisilvae TaxID=2705253 RepID=UPI001891ABCF|nr:ATP-binding cassette domain-containing protein [Catenulispora pinisilvae]